MISLNGRNWMIWKAKMTDLLYCKDLYAPVEGESSKPETMTAEDWKKLDRKTIGTIRQWVDDTVFHHVSNETSANSLWKKLEDLYERKTAGNKAFLIRKLVNLKFKEGDSISEHLNEIQSIVNQLAAMKMVLDDELQALLLLSSLPDSWETLVVSLSNSAPDGVVSMNQVTSSLLNEEIRRKSSGSSHSHALVTENRGRSKSRQPQNRDKSRGKSKAKKDISCYHCGKSGHIKRECRKLKREQKEGRTNEKQEKNESAAVATDNEIVLFSACEEDCANLTCQDSEWVIDSGASYHATPRKDYFTSLREGNLGTVKMGNKNSSQILGIGNICVTTNLGTKMVLKDVRFVPDLRLNLLSTGKLDEEGYTSSFGKGCWKLTKGSLVLARGKKCCTLYKTQFHLENDELGTVEGTSMDLWHKRLGHMSEKGLQTLARRQLLPSMQGTTLSHCDHCLIGKQHRVAFVKNYNKKETDILDLVYSDVCGPINVKTFSGASYFVTFIDDASRKVWVYVIKTKDQVFEVFKDFHAKVERETGKLLKCIHTDNGGEYTSRMFEDYCSEYGIRHQKTVPHTPQHNGVAERMNRTIVERIRSMLSLAKLPKIYWGEAVRTACYLINLSPSVPLDGDIPERVWSGKDVSYSHLRVFGCKAFVHVPKEKRTKLDDKAIPCIFLGYGNDEFGYRLWDPINKKIVRSRDVVFCEDKTLADFEKEEEPQNTHIVPDPISTPIVIPSPMPENNDFQDVQEEDEITGSPGSDQGEHEHAEPLHMDQPPAHQLRRSERERQPSTRYPASEYTMVTDAGEPESFHEAQVHEDRAKWKKAMQEEMDSLHKNHTYDLVELPKNRKALKNKWVFKIKNEGNGQVKYKARLVVKGFSQKQGIDYEEIFSPVVKMSSIRVILGLVASQDLEVEQLDVKTAFLHGDLAEEIYMEQPEGFKIKDKEQLVCKLKKSLYGLKQAPRQWYKRFDSFMLDHGYKRTSADHCVYIQRFSDDDFIILSLYVDDMLVVGKDISKIDRLKKELSKSFDMKDLGAAQHILGMKISRDRSARKLWLSQERYIERVLERFNMVNSKPVSTPLAAHFKLSTRQSPSSKKEKEEMKSIPFASAVGSLMYSMVCTRPDIAHAVGVVSRFLANPGKAHWEAVKWILRYLRGTSKYSLCFGDGKPILEGYTDSDMAGDLDKRKSTSGYLFTFAGGAVSWQSKLQKCIALSTTEAEYIAATEASKELLWMKNFLKELSLKQEKYTLYCDSQSAIDLSKNATYHSRTKHIDVRHHWIRDALENRLMHIKKIDTRQNPSDMMTKPLPKEKHDFCRKKAGMTTV